MKDIQYTLEFYVRATGTQQQRTRMPNNTLPPWIDPFIVDPLFKYLSHVITLLHNDLDHSLVFYPIFSSLFLEVLYPPS